MPQDPQQVKEAAAAANASQGQAHLAAFFPQDRAAVAPGPERSAPPCARSTLGAAAAAASPERKEARALGKFAQALCLQGVGVGGSVGLQEAAGAHGRGGLGRGGEEKSSEFPSELGDESIFWALDLGGVSEAKPG